jgi:hypothetical protein
LSVKLEGVISVWGFAVVGRSHLGPGGGFQDSVAEIDRGFQVAVLRSADETVDDLGQCIDDALFDGLEYFGILQRSWLRAQYASVSRLDVQLVHAGTTRDLTPAAQRVAGPAETDGVHRSIERYGSRTAA